MKGKAGSRVGDDAEMSVWMPGSMGFKAIFIPIVF
jgi:hypothetical protein